MPDILLIQPSIRDFYLTAKRTIPYGLACIASVLLKEGFSVEIFDALATSKSKIIELPPEMTYLKEYYGKPDGSPFALFHHFRHFGYSFEHIGKKAKESDAFLIGIASLFTPYSDEAIKTAQVVKKFHPNCHIVLGGHHPTALPEKVMEYKAIDFVIRGEGEVAMPMLAKMLKSRNRKSNFEAIPGIVFRREDGSLHINEPAMMDNLDSYPLPALHLVKHSFYKRRSGSAVIVASRGCPMKCSYCSVGSSGIKYRRKSVSSVMDEIEQAVTQHQAGFIDFEDEHLTLNREWILKLLHEIIQRFGESALELRAMNGLFPPSLDEEVILMMKKAGFRTLNLSVGTTSESQLKRFRRPDVRKSLENVLEIARKYHLETVCYLIAGAPYQTGEDSVNDLLYLASLLFSGANLLTGVSVFYPAPSSSDYELCAKLGILPERFSLMRSSALPISHTTSRTEAITILRLGRILNFIKSLIDAGEKIPEPAPFSKEEMNIHDRQETGKKLLQCFFYDGKIRGITPDNEIYEHQVSLNLTQKFIRGVRSFL